MTSQDIIVLLIIVCPALLIIICNLYQKFQDENIYSLDKYYNKSINKLYSQFLERSEVYEWYIYPPDLNSYEKYLITFKGWTAQEVYQKIKEHLESILEEYKNTGAFCESDNHALANFLAEIKFASDELDKFKRQKDKFERQKIDTKLSDFS